MEKLLVLLDEGKAMSQKELAVRLNLSEEMIKAQIEYLEHTGILRRIGSNSCSSGCKGCSSKCHENDITFPTMWEKVL